MANRNLFDAAPAGKLMLMRFRPIIFNIAFALNCLLLFLLVLEQFLQVPALLQVFGRLHPLFLHIPIGVFLLYAVLELFTSHRKMESSERELKDALLLASAVTISLTALMGLFLSREEGYDSNALWLHKWGGAITSILVLAWYQWRHLFRRKNVLNKITAVVMVAFITFTGHMGGLITHGENFVLAPILPQGTERPNVPLEEAVVYTHVVYPILDNKCVSCHNQRKAKGELIMETSEMLMKGGKNGALWDTTAADLGLMLQRIHLPLEDDDHMPPKGKPQLTDLEIKILEEWIRMGSDFTIKVAELPPSSTLLALSTEMFEPESSDQYTFAAASPGTVESLNSFYRIVSPVSENSPALVVRFFGIGQFTPDQITQLKPIREQVVELDLSRMPISDQHVALFKDFPNLRKLSLNFTPIDGSGLSQLRDLKSLRELSLAGTRISVNSLKSLDEFQSLKKVFVWSTAVTADEAREMQRRNGIAYYTGFSGDTVIMKLPPPVVQHENFILSSPVDLKLKHYINGAQIRYTLDGTEPDSLESDIYDGKVMIDRPLTVKTKVFRQGWESSDVKTVNFYFSRLRPSNVTLLNPPHPQYKGSGEKTLFDLTLGGNNIANGNWLGYQHPSSFNTVLSFEDSVQATTLTMSGYKSLAAHVFPPSSVTIWYGLDSTNLKKHQTWKYPVPPKDEPGERTSLVFDLPKEKFRYLRIEAIPLSRLPAWHGAKGSPAWVFVDELILQ